MQALMLLKQTLDAQFDPGPLLLNGPNVALTSTQQFFSRGKSKDDVAKSFTIGVTHDDQKGLDLTFTRPTPTSSLMLSEMAARGTNGEYSIKAGQTFTGVDQLPEALREEGEELARFLSRSKSRRLATKGSEDVIFRTTRDRCFLDLSGELGGRRIGIGVGNDAFLLKNILLGIIHVPGLRGNPERVYPRSAVGRSFPGTFDQYVASLIHSWQISNLVQDKTRLPLLNSHLQALGLTWKVQARPIDDATVEILVGRLPHAQQGGAHDMVSIADVGFGVSQVLPVLVALVAARPGQLVYIEQPEIHLHPRAQALLAEILAEHAKRGVLVIVETHSSLLIRGIQTAVAQDLVPRTGVILHWFTRSPDLGFTQVQSAEMDDAGRFGEWPADFDEVQLDAESAYLDAAAEKEAML